MKEAEFNIEVTNGGLIDPKDPRLERVLGWEEYDLFRQPLNFLFPADAHDRVERLFESGKSLEGIVFPRVPLRYKPGGYINFDMTVNSGGSDHWRLDFFKPGTGQTIIDPQKETTDMYSFFNFVEQVLDSPYDGDLDVTMIEVEGLRGDADLSDEQKAAVRSEVETQLKDIAVGGQIGQLDEASYGLLTGGDFDEESFEKELSVAAEKLDIAPESLGLRSNNLTLDDRDVDGDKLKQALSHSKSVFLGEVETDAPLGKLSEVVSGVEHNRNLVLDALKKFGFRTSQRAVSDIGNGMRHATLNQGKVDIDGKWRLPDELIVLIDHPDIAYDHDMAQVDEMLRLLSFNGIKENQERIFYEFCRSTLLSPKFLSALEAILAKYKIPKEMLGIRLRGLPPLKRGGPHWDKVRELSRKGHPMWLDRFGDAVIDEGLAGLLIHGFIEMPPELMKKLSAHFDGKPLMTQLVNIWKEKQVGVVSADLKDIELKRVAGEIGIVLQLEDPAGAG